MPLTRSCHDYLLNLIYGYYTTANLKYRYLLVLSHSKDQKFFVFIILDMGQFKLMQMQSRLMTTSFIIPKLIYRTPYPIPKNKLSLFQKPALNIIILLTYYQHNIIGK